MKRWIRIVLRWTGNALALALLTMFLSTCAYFTGIWPQWLELSVEGPSGWRLTRVDEEEVDEHLPSQVAEYLGIGSDGESVECLLEIASGDERARCRVRAWNGGNFKSGHKALPRSVESQDGSLWLLDDWMTVTAYPAVPGRAWFGCGLWVPQQLEIDGRRSESTYAYAHSVPADSAWHEVVAAGWTLRFLAAAGTSIHVAESSGDAQTVLSLDESGFSSGALSVGREPSTPIAMRESLTLEGERKNLALYLVGEDGAEVRLELDRTLRRSLTLRVSR